jgi:hypothetical protein
MKSQSHPIRTRVVAVALLLTLAVPTLADTVRRAPEAPAASLSLGGVVGAVLNTTWSIVNGLLGADLQSGPWETKMPAGVFIGTTKVTVTSKTGALPTVDLSLANQILNHFLKPVQLVYHVPAGVDPNSITILWWDPATSVWVPVQGKTVDLANGTVTVPLQHFSTYGAAGGRVGW